MAHNRVMTIEILHTPGCPQYEPARELLRRVMVEEGIPESDIQDIEIVDEHAAVRTGMLGSPTMRIDGVDVEPATTVTLRGIHAACRYYPGGIAATETWIRDAIRKSK
jgi:hypothetical protein